MSRSPETSSDSESDLEDVDQYSESDLEDVDQAPPAEMPTLMAAEATIQHIPVEMSEESSIVRRAWPPHRARKYRQPTSDQSSHSTSDQSSHLISSPTGEVLVKCKREIVHMSSTDQSIEEMLGRIMSEHSDAKDHGQNIRVTVR